ncbi:MAG: CotH kinase family protein [Bacillota bacterium]
MKGRIAYVLVPVIILGLALFVSLTQSEHYYNRTYQHEQSTQSQTIPLEAAELTTHLPVISVDTRNQTIPGALLLTPTTHYQLSEEGLSEINVDVSLFDEEEVKAKAMFRVRGNSSRLFEKKSYALSFVNNDFTDRELEVFGMEQDNNWALHGPALDRTLLRNYLAMNLSGELMPYAPDVRFVELVIDGSYEGVYLMMETVSKGEGRVDIPTPEPNSRMTSYIVEIDRAEKLAFPLNDFLVDTYRVYPSATELTYPTDQQYSEARFKFIDEDYSKIAKKLYQIPYGNESNDYKTWVDETAFYDYFIMNELFRNVDAGYYSTYFYRNLRGKLTPVVWDFNNSLNNYQEVSFDETGFSLVEAPFFEQLLIEERFVEGLIDRYHLLRAGKLSDERLNGLIDESVVYLGEAITRNNDRWTRYFDHSQYSTNDFLQPIERNPTSYDAALMQMKDYLFRRSQWLDDHIDVLYQYSHPSRHSFSSVK